MGSSRCRLRSRTKRISAGAVFLVACAPAPPVTVVEVAPLPTPPPPVITAAPPPRARVEVECEAPPRDGCTPIARVRIDKVRLSSPTCVVDTQIKEGDVGRVMKCPRGSYVQFPDAVFGGTFDGVEVSTCMKTEFPFSDGCTWQTMQRIAGRTDTAMSYSYSERAISGHDCAPVACRANATLYVLP